MKDLKPTPLAQRPRFGRPVPLAARRAQWVQAPPAQEPICGVGGYQHPSGALRQLCTHFAASCSGFWQAVTSLVWPPSPTFANSAPDQPFFLSFCNELKLDGDGWAQLAPFGDFPGVAIEPKADGSIHRFDAVQRMDKDAALVMVANFKSPWGRLKRYFTGCPIYVGHPDVPGMGSEYTDKASKGMITDLEVRPDGLFARPVFTNEGSEIVEGRKLRAFSARWSTKFIGEVAGRKTFRPETLISAGLTNSPNLPVQLLNDRTAVAAPDATADAGATQKDQMKREVIIALLTKHGIEIANTATDEQIEAGLNKLAEKAASAVTLANEKTTAETTLANEKAAAAAKDKQILDLTTRATSAETSFANERKARIDTLIAGAITDGRVTAAEKADWERRLNADFGNESVAIGKLSAKIKTGSSIGNLGDRRVEVANMADRRAKIQELVTVEMKTKGLDYDTAFSAVQKTHPNLFQAFAA